MRLRNKLFAILFCAALIGAGCQIGQRLEPGGAYSHTETSAAMPELYVADATFDLAYSALDGVFKFERDNRQTLWKISPEIKHTLDKLRKEAGQLVKDYAIARAAYLASPTPAGATELQIFAARLSALNASALAVIQTKGAR